MTLARDCIAIYARISVDKTGRVEGVQRQEKWGRAYARKMIEDGRWEDLPIRVFVDNDRSAFIDDVERPGYDALRDAIRAGEVRHLWSVETSRIEANRRRWVDFVIDLADAGIEELHTDRDGVVRMDEVADIKHIVAWHERRRAQKRILDTLADLADDGRPNGGARYGYRPGRGPTGVPTLEVVPEEAAVIRWAASAVLAGESVSSLCECLNTVNAVLIPAGHRGVPPKLAGRRRSGRVVPAVWSHAQLLQVLRSPTAAGWRVHRGNEHRRGMWQPVLDEVTWRRLRAVLDQRREVRRRGGETMAVGGPAVRGRSYWLSGLLTCGRCGNGMTGRTQRGRRDQRVRLYFCLRQTKASAGEVGCSRLAVYQDLADNEVESRFLAWLDTDAVRQSVTAGDADEAARAAEALAAVEAKRVALARRWTADELTDEEWDAARADLDQRARELSARLGEATRAVAPAPEVVREAWHGMTRAEQRQVLELFLDRIVVHPAAGGSFDPTRIEMVDRGGTAIPTRSVV